MDGSIVGGAGIIKNESVADGLHPNEMPADIDRTVNSMIFDKSNTTSQ